MLISSYVTQSPAATLYRPTLYIKVADDKLTFLVC